MRLAMVLPNDLPREDALDIENIITELSHTYQIDLILGNKKILNLGKNVPISFHDEVWFSKNANLFDRIVYCFCNTPATTRVFSLFKTIPGVVVLQDFSLSKVYGGDADNEEQLREQLALALYKCHGYSALKYLKAEGVKKAGLFYSCNIEILEQAKGIIVNKESCFVKIQESYKHSEVILNKTIPATNSGGGSDISASKYYQAIESFYANDAGRVDSLIDEIAQRLTQGSYNDSLIKEIAHSLALTFPQQKSRRTVFLDITETVRCDARTGIQRVARALTQEMIMLEAQNVKVEPVYLKEINGKWAYHYAHQYVCNMIGVPSATSDDLPIDVSEGDIVLHLDVSLNAVERACQLGMFDFLRSRGVLIYFIIHDLLPVFAPQYYTWRLVEAYNEWLTSVIEADGVICVSQAVADDFRKWKGNGKIDFSKGYKVLVNHNGADIDNSFPTKGLPDNSSEVFSAIESRPTFLMVSTIEPRKGYAQAIGAFQQLWEEQTDINLIIVGKNGWLVDELIKKIEHHNELNKRLFWLQGISDEYLELLYKKSHVLIAASEGEGFGLPLIEAAQHKLPIIARDIPVFREVAGDHAFYFSGKEPKNLADAVLQWLSLYKNKKHPLSDNMPYLTWEESAKQLLDLVLQE